MENNVQKLISAQNTSFFSSSPYVIDCVVKTVKLLVAELKGIYKGIGIFYYLTKTIYGE